MHANNACLRQATKKIIIHLLDEVETNIKHYYASVGNGGRRRSSVLVSIIARISLRNPYPLQE